ncbi:MAG: hypothetical protein Unbinned6201contig1000_11 [Prokaryotic dsDNA virus sp.]|nr:MAG: hypothetical protein Unbinned6201contig1000_11 [Prokaryotic dsDNA virus sp.]|tara:strand:+ start:76 stop:627 length:552 start_codon:yes stop_codon:yes gene_type:complete
MGNRRRFIPYQIHSLSGGSSTGKSLQEKWGLDKGSIGKEPEVKFSPFATTTPRVQRRIQPDSPTRTVGPTPTGSSSLVRSTYKMPHPGIPYKRPDISGSFHQSRRGQTPTAGILDYSQYENPPITRATKTERAIAGVSFYGASEAPKIPQKAWVSNKPKGYPEPTKRTPETTYLGTKYPRRGR